MRKLNVRVKQRGLRDKISEIINIPLDGEI